MAEAGQPTVGVSSWRAPARRPPRMAGASFIIAGARLPSEGGKQASKRANRNERTNKASSWN